MERNQSKENQANLINGLNVKLAWMYHNIMDLYGDKGNVLSLQKRAAQHGINLEIQTIGIGEEADLRDFDMIFIGGGADKEQSHMMPDLLSRRENLKQAIEENSFVLLICGGYQFFGKYYLDADGNRMEGLGFYDYYTEAPSNHERCIGNVVVEAQLDGEPFVLIGFENHGGQTRNVISPLGKVRFGNGNEFGSEYEGFYDGHVLGTYLHGPLLPKNSKLTDFILIKALQKRNPGITLDVLNSVEVPFEKEARNNLLKRFGLEELSSQ